MNKKLEIKSLYRVGIVVKDVDAKRKAICEHFEVKEDEIYYEVEEGQNVKNCVYEDKPLAFRTKCCIIPLANIELELLQPLDENGPYAAFLREHGEGVQHFNIEVDDPGAFNKLMEELELPTVIKADMPADNMKFTYYDCHKIMGTVLELVEEL